VTRGPEDTTFGEILGFNTGAETVDLMEVFKNLKVFFHKGSENNLYSFSE